MSADNLLALADRCEAAAGPDRELDVEITVALDLAGRSALSAVPFTASIDAAMTLAPEGRIILNIAEDGITTAIVCGTQGCADTPALALCAAALRARASIELARQEDGQ